MAQDVREFKDPKIHKLVRKERAQGDALDLFGESPPSALLSDYPLDKVGHDRSVMMQKKFTNRRHNIERCWNQVQQFMPELLTSPPQDVLEISTGHGAMLEILRHYGHTVMGTDYANTTWSCADEDADKPDWPFRHIVESIDLPMTVYDASETPSCFETNSYDMVMCFQALEHQGHPDDWMDMIDDFCRVSRKSVFVMLSRVNTNARANTDYTTSFNSFCREVRRYRKNGFVCTGSFVQWGQTLGFKLIAE